MVKDTGIEWADSTFNPVMGCAKVSEACRNCYAMEQVNRYGGDFLGKRVMTTDNYWKEPLKWNKEAAKAGETRRVFCASLSDVFEDYDGPILNSKGQRFAVWPDGSRFTVSESDVLPHIPGGVRSYWMTLDDVRARLFRLIDETPNLVWMLLTKRPENILSMWPKVGFPDSGIPGTLGRKLYLQNVWLGTTVENQEQADKRIPELLKCRDLAPVLFLSCEPLLGHVEFSDVSKRSDCVSQLGGPALNGIGWVICGGESGKNARPMNPQWALSMRDQCKVAGVPFHFKQWGEWHPIHGTGLLNEMDDEEHSPYAWINADGSCSQSGSEPSKLMLRIGKKQSGRLLDGKEWNELPVEWHLQQMADDAQRLDMGY